MGILYSRHLSTTNTFLRNGWNDAETLITKPLCSRHFITDTSLSQLTLPPRTELWIINLFNIRHFLQEICMHFIFDNVLHFCLRFLWSLLLCFFVSLMAFSGPLKFRDCKFVAVSSLYLSLWLTCFPVAKMTKRQWVRDRNMDTIMEISVVHGQPLPYSENYYEPKKQHLVHFVDWLFQVLQTLTNQCLPNYHINMISCNILFLSSFFSQHRPFDTLWIQLHYTKTP